MVKTANKLKIAGLGEVLWDIQNEQKTLGGAPANFACHCANLGASSYIISCVGNDALGKDTIAFLKTMNINTEGIARDNMHNTGTVNVLLNDKGIPSYEIKEQVAWDNITYNAELAKSLASLDAVCFGTLALRSEISKNTIMRYLDELPDTCLKVFDINIRQQYYSKESIITSLEKADVLKLNDEELPLLTTYLKIEGNEIAQLKTIRELFNLKLVILTKGAKGSIMLTSDEISKASINKSVKVASTVGAGDSFTATAIVGFLLNKPLNTINEKANRVAAYVCTQIGAVPKLPDDLKYS